MSDEPFPHEWIDTFWEGFEEKSETIHEYKNYIETAANNQKEIGEYFGKYDERTLLKYFIQAYWRQQEMMKVVLKRYRPKQKKKKKEQLIYSN